MKTLPLLFAASISASIPLALSARSGPSGRAGTEIALSPAVDLVVVKTFEHSTELELSEFSALQDGEDPGHDMQVEHSTVQTLRLRVTDTYAAVGEDGPTRVERTYDEVAGTAADHMSAPGADDRSFEIELAGEVEGLGVVFTLGDGGWEAELAEESAGADESLLAGLEQDLDHTALLPAGEVEEGEAWDVDPERFLEVIDPGGFLKLHPEEAEGDADWEELAAEEAARELEITGDVTATLTGIREEGGARTAVVALAVDLTTLEDNTERIRAQMEKAEHEGEFTQVFDEMTEQYVYAGEGELLWDLARGIPLSLTLELDAERTQHQVMTIAFAGEEHEIEQTMVFDGTLNAAVTYEVGE